MQSFHGRAPGRIEGDCISTRSHRHRRGRPVNPACLFAYLLHRQTAMLPQLLPDATTGTQPESKGPSTGWLFSRRKTARAYRGHSVRQFISDCRFGGCGFDSRRPRLRNNCGSRPSKTPLPPEAVALPYATIPLRPARNEPKPDHHGTPAEHVPATDVDSRERRDSVDSCSILPALGESRFPMKESVPQRIITSAAMPRYHRSAPR